MTNKFVFYSLFFILLFVGSWGVARTGLFPSLRLEKIRIDKQDKQNIEDARAARSVHAEPQRATTTSRMNKPVKATSDFIEINSLIVNGHSPAAANMISRRYSYLSRIDLEQLKQNFLDSAIGKNEKSKKRILLAASRVFDELDVWKALAEISVLSADWHLAFDAQLRASALENDSIRLDALLRRLLRSSHYLRSELEKNNDQIGIKTMYQRLVDLHPNFSLFQLELAKAQYQLGNHQVANELYTSLKFDTEVGDTARLHLHKANTRQDSQIPVTGDQNLETIERRLEETPSQKDIVIPLIARGGSFIVGVSVERHSSHLLLDTGASITALSTEVIKKLNLAPTGRSIRLSTANGVTHSKLYRVHNLSLGPLILKNLVIAEVDIDLRGGFDGLLGTDALNRFKPDYSYIIDNQKKALIFRAQ
jgi:hypothetical protein